MSIYYLDIRKVICITKDMYDIYISENKIIVSVNAVNAVGYYGADELKYDMCSYMALWDEVYGG